LIDECGLNQSKSPGVGKQKRDLQAAGPGMVGHARRVQDLAQAQKIQAQPMGGPVSGFAAQSLQPSRQMEKRNHPIPARDNGRGRD
jgi:hypothetical protein